MQTSWYSNLYCYTFLVNHFPRHDVKRKLTTCPAISFSRAQWETHKGGIPMDTMVKYSVLFTIYFPEASLVSYIDSWTRQSLLLQNSLDHWTMGASLQYNSIGIHLLKRFGLLKKIDLLKAIFSKYLYSFLKFHWSLFGQCACIANCLAQSIR